MAVLNIGVVEGLDTDTYDKINQDLGLPDRAPDGLISHTAAPADNGLMVVDIWESNEKFESFMQDELMPAFEKAGFQAPENPQPPQQYEVHNRWPS